MPIVPLSISPRKNSTKNLPILYRIKYHADVSFFVTSFVYILYKITNYTKSPNEEISCVGIKCTPEGAKEPFGNTSENLLVVSAP